MVQCEATKKRNGIQATKASFNVLTSNQIAGTIPAYADQQKASKIENEYDV